MILRFLFYLEYVVAFRGDKNFVSPKPYKALEDMPLALIENLLDLLLVGLVETGDSQLVALELIQELGRDSWFLDSAVHDG